MKYSIDKYVYIYLLYKLEYFIGKLIYYVIFNFEEVRLYKLNVKFI